MIVIFPASVLRVDRDPLSSFAIEQKSADFIRRTIWGNRTQQRVWGTQGHTHSLKMCLIQKEWRNAEWPLGVNGCPCWGHMHSGYVVYMLPIIICVCMSPMGSTQSFELPRRIYICCDFYVFELTAHPEADDPQPPPPSQHLPAGGLEEVRRYSAGHQFCSQSSTTTFPLSFL